MGVVSLVSLHSGPQHMLALERAKDRRWLAAELEAWNRRRAAESEEPDSESDQRDGGTPHEDLLECRSRADRTATHLLELDVLLVEPREQTHECRSRQDHARH